MIIPRTTTPRALQASYRKIFDAAKKSGPVIVMTNNKPDVAIIDVKELDRLYTVAEKTELIQAMEVIAEYKAEKASGTIKKGRSLTELLDE